MILVRHDFESVRSCVWDLCLPDRLRIGRILEDEDLRQMTMSVEGENEMDSVLRWDELRD